MFIILLVVIVAGRIHKLKLIKLDTLNTWSLLYVNYNKTSIWALCLGSKCGALTSHANWTLGENHALPTAITWEKNPRKDYYGGSIKITRIARTIKTIFYALSLNVLLHSISQAKIPLANDFRVGLKGKHIAFTVLLQHVLPQLLQLQVPGYS